MWVPVATFLPVAVTGLKLRLCVTLALVVPGIWTVGAALASRRISNRALAFCVGIAGTLGAAFSILFVGWIAGVGIKATLGVSSAVAIVLVAIRWRSVRETMTEPVVRDLGVSWLIFLGWCLGLLALVRTYSGGGWAADWVEHWQRAIFFRERQPLTTLFAAVYPLTARPPLANVLTAAWLELTGAHFAAYQVFLTLFGSLVSLPVCVLARMWSKSPNASRWAVFVLMLSPLVAQNVTFAWTKLPTAFFVLTAIAALVHAARERSAVTLPVTAWCLGLGLLTHYSAAAWLLALGLAAAWAARRVLLRRDVQRQLVVGAVSFFLVTAPWFAWAAWQFGLHGTAAANSTAAAWAGETPVERVWVALANLFDTIVPFPLRSDVSLDLIRQTSALGRLRDVAFSLYQLNLLFACGIAGTLILLWRAGCRRLRAPASAPAALLMVAIPLAIAIGVWVHTPRDTWGLVHICLQPLVLLGLASVASTLADQAAFRSLWALVATVDFVLGIALHFALESWPVPAGHSPAAVLANETLNHTAAMNACDKLAFGFSFFSDILALPTFALWGWLAGLLALALCRLMPAGAVGARFPVSLPRP